MGGNSTDKVQKAAWPPHVEKTLLEIVKNDEMPPGRKRFTMSEDRLAAIATELNGSTGMSLTPGQVKGKFTRWLKEWRIWKKLMLQSSGMGYRNELGMFLCDDWDALERKIPGSKKLKGKAFPLFDELDQLLFDQMADKSIVISSNHLPKRSGKYVTLDDSDEDVNLGNAFDECESPLPKEKRKGKRSAQGDWASGSKSNKSSEGASAGGIQSCIDAFNKCMAMRGNQDTDTETVLAVMKALKALKVDPSTFAAVGRHLSKSKFLTTMFIYSDEAEQRAMIDQYLGK